MIIFVDIDNTICTREEDYAAARPIPSRIKKINTLFDEGNTIIYWTARGTKTGKIWFQTTLGQLESWGAKFHELRLGKPYYDVFIDDKNINSDIFFKEVR